MSERVYWQRKDNFVNIEKYRILWLIINNYFLIDEIALNIQFPFPRYYGALSHSTNVAHLRPSSPAEAAVTFNEAVKKEDEASPPVALLEVEIITRNVQEISRQRRVTFVGQVGSFGKWELACMTAWKLNFIYWKERCWNRKFTTYPVRTYITWCRKDVFTRVNFHLQKTWR